ncbi:MAG: PAS domain-containing protein [Magnetococcales bacterium]|nr:PAS domain-containing protein [Magnetococcales bacterium]
MLCRSLCQTLLEKNADGILVISRAGRVLFANPAAERLFSRKHGELLDQDMGFPVTAGESAEVDLVPRGQEPGVAEMRVVEISWYRRSTAFLVSLRDISDRKRMELDLQQAKEVAEEANQAKNRFLSNMSHELRTPLNAVIGFSSLLMEKEMGPLSETQQEFLQGVLFSGKNLLSLVNNLLDLADAAAGQSAANLQIIDLKVFLASRFSLVRDAALAKRIQLKAHWKDAPDIWVTDPRLLGRILDHLLGNAIKFTADGGRVELIAQMVKDSQQGSLLELSVIDSGVGIHPQNLERIFQPFEQEDGSSTRAYAGVGVGLALVRQWVQQLGGQVMAESQGLCRGSRFQVVLPLHGKETDGRR